jgi:hypothetical protein
MRTSRPHLPPLVTRPSLLIGCPQSSSQEQATADQREDDPNPRTVFLGTLLSPDDAVLTGHKRWSQQATGLQ